MGAIFSSQRQHICRRPLSLCRKWSPFHGLSFIFCFPYYTDTQFTKASKQNQSKERIYTERKTSRNDHLSWVSISNSGKKPWSNHNFHLLSLRACTLLAGDGHLVRYQSSRLESGKSPINPLDVCGRNTGLMMSRQ